MKTPSRIPSFSLVFGFVILCLSFTANAQIQLREINGHDDGELKIENCEINYKWGKSTDRVNSYGPLKGMQCEKSSYENKPLLSCAYEGDLQKLKNTTNTGVFMSYHFSMYLGKDYAYDKLVNKISMMAKKCNDIAMEDIHPVGSYVSVDAWENRSAGYSAQIVSIIAPNKVYRVKVTDIHYSSGTGLRGNKCTENQSITKYEDEGKIFTIGKECFKW